MKAILEFNLPEEKSEHLAAVKGTQWYLAMYDLDNWLRDQIKHPPSLEDECQFFIDTRAIILQNVRDKLREIRQDNFVSFEELE